MRTSGRIRTAAVGSEVGANLSPTVAGFRRACAEQAFRRPLSLSVAGSWVANAIFDAHRDDPEFGYRILADEIRHAGIEVSDRTVWRIGRDNRWWSVFGKPKSYKGSRPGTPAHDDLLQRVFNADGLNQLWVSDLTELWIAEGKIYCCAIKDLCSNRIVGWALDSRMKARLVVAAIDMAVARRNGDVAGCILHSDRGSGNFVPGRCSVL